VTEVFTALLQAEVWRKKLEGAGFVTKATPVSLTETPDGYTATGLPAALAPTEPPPSADDVFIPPSIDEILRGTP
jgi:hypothetical protein